ncbi:universal stress protein [Pleurocapsales cyanobacterium LEGE 10410]|nr:universal stress protein [Pleurocapsales cyanobacterium LEGE 10410]
MIDKILVAIDSFDNNNSVYKAAVSLAQATRANLMLLHILSEEDPGYPMLPTYAYYSVLKDTDGGIFREKFIEYEQAGIDCLKKLAQEAIAVGVDTEYSQLSGIPGWEICELASAWSADLIVVGSRGLKGLKEMFLGSVSNYVTHHAPCSVLIVRMDTDSVSDFTDLPHQEAAPKPEVATNN